MNWLDDRGSLRKETKVWANLNTANGGVANGKAEVQQTDDSYIIKVHVPTVPEDNFRVTLDYQKLIVSAMLKPIKDNSPNMPIFKKIFTLPNYVNVDRIEAIYGHGELTIILPYLEIDKDLHRDIDIRPV